MDIKNLHFFDKYGYELNFNWNKKLDRWEGNIYLPKVSVGLYSNTTIYILEEVTINNKKEYVFPRISDDGKWKKVSFRWDIENRFVDEFFMFTFDDSYRTTDTSSLIYTPNDGPDINYIAMTMFDIYDINLAEDLYHKALPLHIAFTSPEKYDATTYKRTLYMECNFNTLATINFFAETIEEDERLNVLNSNFGYNIKKEDTIIFKKSDIKEPKPNYQLLNEKRKELMITGNEIYNYIGSYKALFNALKFFGYDNLNILDIWKNENEYSDNFGKFYYVKKYTLTDNEIIFVNLHNITLPNTDFKKSPNIALSYYINNPIKDFDIFELPKTKERFDYTIEEAMIKLFALRKKLNTEFLPGRSKIIDIMGEASYFGLCGIMSNARIGSILHYEDNSDDIEIEIYPNKNIRLTNNKLFKEYIIKKFNENWNESEYNLSTLSQNALEKTLYDIDFKNEYEFVSEFIGNSESNLCNNYKEFYEKLNISWSIYEDITNDLHDYYEEKSNYRYIKTYSDGSQKESNTLTKNDKTNLIRVVINPTKNNEIKIGEFESYENLSEVYISKHITKINKDAFKNCTKLEKIIIPNTVTKIDANILYGCNELTKIIYLGSENEWKYVKGNKLWNKKDEDTYHDNEIINYFSTLDKISAKVILSLSDNFMNINSSTFDNLDYTFDNINNYYTFDNIDNHKYNEIEWSVTYSEDQVDDDLLKIGISKNYFNENKSFTQTKSGSTLNEMEQVFFELPYVGYYDVKITIKNNYNNITSKILPKYIKVEPYNLDIRGFYYDARQIPDNLIDNDYSKVLYDDNATNIELDPEYALYFEMKEFIINKLKYMTEMAIPEHGSKIDKESMPIYKTTFDTFLYMGKNYIKFYDNDNKSIFRIYITDEDDLGSYNCISFNENNEQINTQKVNEIIGSPKSNNIIIQNNGPYYMENIFEEWYLSDNTTIDLSKLQPNIKYAKYIKNGVNVKPYTWVLLGYEYSHIYGKCNPKWTLINTSTEEIVSTHEGKFFTYLLTDEGNYTIQLTVDDVNGNHYYCERNLFEVSKTAYFELYTPFFTDFETYYNNDIERKIRSNYFDFNSSLISAE